MNKTPQAHNVHDLIERYNRELLAAYRQQQPLTAEQLDTEYPLPDIERDRQALAVAATPTPPAEPTPPPAEPAVPPAPITAPQDTESAPYIGYLQIYAYTGNTAEPIEGAQVFVSRDNDGEALLYASTVTDRSGLTPVIPLPSVDPMLSMNPETAQSALPYIAYDIQVSALGFTPIRFENVPIYGGNSVTQPAAMLPLIAGDNPDLERVYRSGGPANL